MSLAEAEARQLLSSVAGELERAAEEGGEATIAARARELLGKLGGNRFTWWWSAIQAGQDVVLNAIVGEASSRGGSTAHLGRHHAALWRSTGRDGALREWPADRGGARSGCRIRHRSRESEERQAVGRVEVGYRAPACGTAWY